MPIVALFKKEAVGSGVYLTVMLALAGAAEFGLLHIIRASFHARAADIHLREVLLFLLLLSIAATTTVRARKCTARLCHHLAMRLFDESVTRLARASLTTFEDLGRAEIYNTLMVDTQKLIELADEVAAAQNVVVVSVSGFAYLLWFSPLAFGLTAAALAGGIAVFGLAYRHVRRMLLASREREKDLFHFINHLIFGFKELKVNPQKMADFFRTDLTNTFTAYKTMRIRAKNLSADLDVFSTFLDYARFLPILFVLPFVARASQSVIPQIVAVMLFIPLTDLKDLIRDVMAANVAVTRLLRLHDALDASGREEMQWPVNAPHHFHTLSYQNITFAYTDRQGAPIFRIGPLNLTLTAGEIVFLIGGNGSGKTTFMKVMVGLYPPCAGQIELDGAVIRMAQHRYLFATIFTDFHLFDRFYGLSDVPPQEVQRLLELLALTHKVRFANGRFSTQDLSGGQRKRLALICSLLEDKPMYIFDEWAAGQDPEFRAYFYLTLLPQFKQAGKTIFAITHDDQYFHVADRILKIDQGQFAPVA